MKLSDKILTLRKKQGMSQEELAEKLNVSRQAVSRWEMGAAQPDASNLLQLSRLFGVSADYLLNDDYAERQKMSAESAIPEEDPKVSTENAVRESGQGILVAGAAKKADRGRIAGLCAAGIGLLGNLVVYLLSRIYLVPVPWTSYDESGRKWYHWSGGHTGRSYVHFIRHYELEFLAVLFWVMAVAGLALFFLLPVIRQERKDVIA